VDRIELLAAKQEIVSAHVPDDVSVRVDDLALRGLGDQAAAGLLEVPSLRAPACTGHAARIRGPAPGRKGRSTIGNPGKRFLSGPVPVESEAGDFVPADVGHGHQRTAGPGAHQVADPDPAVTHVLEPELALTIVDHIGVSPDRRSLEPGPWREPGPGFSTSSSATATGQGSPTRSPHGHGDIARRREPAARHAAVAWWVRKRVDGALRRPVLVSPSLA